MKDILGPSTPSGLTSFENSPVTSTPGTPAANHTVSLPGPSTLSISSSGRVSRQSDVSTSDRYTSSSTQAQSATEHVIDRSVTRHTLNPINVQGLCSAVTPRLHVELIDVEQELFVFPQKACMFPPPGGLESSHVTRSA